MSETINQRISIYRKLAGMTQAEVAEKLDMKSSTYSQMERQGSIKTEMLLKLSGLFGIKPEMLLYPISETSTDKEIDFSAPEPTGGLHLKQELPFQAPPTGPSQFVITHKEETVLKILRNLPKSARDEIFQIIHLKMQECKKK